MSIYTHSVGPTTFGDRGVAVTPGASDLPGGIAKAVVCLTDGSLTIVPAGNANNQAIEFVNVPAGFSPPFRVRRVTAATASVVAVYD